MLQDERASHSHGKPHRSHGKPSRSDGKPSRPDGKPSRSDGKPSRSDGKPRRSHGKPSRSHGKPRRSDGRPSHEYPKPCNKFFASDLTDFHGLLESSSKPVLTAAVGAGPVPARTPATAFFIVAYIPPDGGAGWHGACPYTEHPLWKAISKKSLHPLHLLHLTGCNGCKGCNPFSCFGFLMCAMRETNRSVAFGEKSTKSFKSFNYSHLFDLSDL